MTPDQAKASYKRMLGDTVTVRRYTGMGSGSRPRFEASARARVKGYEPQELVGGVQQGDRKVIVYVDDLIDGGFALPIVPGANSNDKVVIRGRECSIIACDDSTRRVNGVAIAIDLQVRG